MKELILDTETTGLSTKEGHRIVEIGCLELENLIPTKKNFHCYLNPERKVSDKALEVHGYTDEFLSDKKKFSEIVTEFLDFIENKRLIIHNADFDLSHINNEMKIVGKKPIKNDIVDTLILARDKFPGSPINLDALCKLLSKVYINLIDQKEPKLDFQNEVVKGNISVNNNKSYFKKVILPTPQELNKHKEYLKNRLKKNFFN